MRTIKSIEFYRAWLAVVSQKKQELLSNWHKYPEYTKSIITSDDSVMLEVAQELGLNCYNADYYSIDAILYENNDLVPEIQPNTWWLRDVRVAFEHENVFGKSLYQEVSHLLITNCDLMVLVTYPDSTEKNVLEYLHKVILGNRRSHKISEKENFLLIFGGERDFEWSGLVYKTDGWKRLLV